MSLHIVILNFEPGLEVREKLPKNFFGNQGILANIISGEKVLKKRRRERLQCKRQRSK
jgi:hypothetical protein